MSKKLWPVLAKTKNITSGYGNRTLKSGKIEFHAAWDIQAPAGTPILAPDGAVVKSVKSDAARGKYMVIQDTEGVYMQFQHAQDFITPAGTQLRPGCHMLKGDTIGHVGSTGKSSAPHLDFSMGTVMTPAGYIEKASKFDPAGYEWQLYDDYVAKPAAPAALFTTAPKSEWLNIRADADSKAGILGRFEMTDTAPVTATKRDKLLRQWYFISIRGVNGYVAGWMCRKV